MFIKGSDHALSAVERQPEMSQSARAILVPNSHLARGNGLYVPLSVCLPWFFSLCLSTSLDSVSAYLSVCLSVCLSLSLPTSLSLSVLLSQSVSIFLCLPLSVSVFQFLSVLSLCLCIFLWPTECFSVKLSLSLFLSVLICLSACVSVCQSLFLCLTHSAFFSEIYMCNIYVFPPVWTKMGVFSFHSLHCYSVIFSCPGHRCCPCFTNPTESCWSKDNSDSGNLSVTVSWKIWVKIGCRPHSVPVLLLADTSWDEQHHVCWPWQHCLSFSHQHGRQQVEQVNDSVSC